MFWLRFIELMELSGDYGHNNVTVNMWYFESKSITITMIDEYLG